MVKKTLWSTSVLWEVTFMALMSTAVDILRLYYHLYNPW